MTDQRGKDEEIHVERWQEACAQARDERDEWKRKARAANAEAHRFQQQAAALPGIIAAWIELRIARGYRDDVGGLASAIRNRCWEVDGPGDFTRAAEYDRALTQAVIAIGYATLAAVDRTGTLTMDLNHRESVTQALRRLGSGWMAAASAHVKGQDHGDR